MAACLAPLAIWILLSGLDDLFIGLVLFLNRRKQFPWPADAALEQTPERRIAIFVPLWREHRVIGPMLEHNLSLIRYANYDVFVGVYPNDELTADAVAEIAERYPRVHLAICPHDGPTSKGDCLNWIHRRMADYEARHAVRFELVITHDAEDLIHPDSLRLANWFSRQYAMVQIPVLPLASGLRELTHGLYCDDFAEYQQKDIPVRCRLGGFLPSNGVGTAYERAALDRLAERNGGRIFDPACLTEDYENGFRLHALGYRQIFVPVRFDASGPVATREYFPKSFRAAVRQRSRWVAGIALQGWQHHGWRAPWRQVYWFWRDRKGLVGNLLSPATNLLFLYGMGSCLAGSGSGRFWHLGSQIPLWVARCYAITLAVSVTQIAMRAWLGARIYGWRFAAGVPVRILWGNLLNCAATAAAIRQFASARLRRHTLAWRKTEHVYPRLRLGELLVHMRCLAAGDVEEALLSLPKGLRLGECLLQLQRVSEEHLHQALSLQAGVPLRLLSEHAVNRQTPRALPASLVKA
ncbi:MAG: glycosyl transferase family protein [Acidobacteriia bacterium]|nr:glycosyl transferase family protein [Terriglobia bacterium]